MGYVIIFMLGFAIGGLFENIAASKRKDRP